MPSYLRLALIVSAFTACASTNTVTIPAPATDGGAEEDAATGDAGDPGTEDASVPMDANGSIGTRSDKGNDTVEVNTSSHGTYACGDVCAAAGGSCQVGGQKGVGYVYRKYNDGSGTWANRIDDCDETESYVSGNTTMTGMQCYCSGMKAPPTVRVRKSEGLFTCDKVCASWSLKCNPKRAQYSYGNEEETTSTPLDCKTVPAATTHHYLCSCDP